MSGGGEGEGEDRQTDAEPVFLPNQLSDMREAMARAEAQAARREENLRQEIADVEERLRQAETRGQELTESVTHATRPLLRQIETLQQTATSQAEAWEVGCWRVGESGGGWTKTCCC